MTKAISRVTALVVIVAGAAASALAAQEPRSSVLTRRYREGETFSYVMTTSNKGKTDTLTYTIKADATVKKDTGGHFFEEIAWSGMDVNGKPFALPASNQSFRQVLTLEPNAAFNRVPDLSKVHPILIGPITDLLTFYADLFVSRQHELSKAGDHFYFKHGTPASWADGQHVTIGEDSIDFDVTLSTIDQSAGTATITVQHVPATPSQIKIPAEWMRAPVTDTPNNWVQVEHTGATTFVASIGRETFDVTVVLSLEDGRILSATLDNPVQVMERECKDAALADCGAPARYEIHRHVEIRTVR
jgi:hypothetical protein